MANYKDTALNRRMGRVGKPHGSSDVTKAKLKARPPADYRKKAAPVKKKKIKFIIRKAPPKVDKSRMMSVKLGLKGGVSKKWAKANPDYLEKHKKVITRGEKAPMGFKGEYEIYGHRDRKNWKDRGSHWSITGKDPRDSMFDDEHQKDPEFMRRIGLLKRKKDGTPMGIEKMMEGYKKEIGGWDKRKLI